MWEIMDVRKNFIKVLFLCVFFLRATIHILWKGSK